MASTEPTADPARGPCAKGAFLLNMWAALRTLAGSPAVDRAIARMAPDEQQEIVHAQAISWVRMATASKLVDVVADEARVPVEKLYDDAVKMGVDLTYGGVWKVLLRFATAEMLVKRSALLYSKARSVGALDAEMVVGGANLELKSFPGATDRQVRSLALASARLLEIAGERDVRWTMRMKSDGAFIQLRWAQR